MLYDTSKLRRQDRALPQEEAFQLLKDAEYGILCMQHFNGGGYGIPINYAWDGDSSLYMHCAHEGFKLNCLAKEPRVTFVITGATRLLPNQFSTAYESVMVHGEAQVVTGEAERQRALHLLIQRLLPQEIERGKKYIAGAAHATTVIRLSISRICGKAHRV